MPENQSEGVAAEAAPEETLYASSEPAQVEQSVEPAQTEPAAEAEATTDSQSDAVDALKDKDATEAIAESKVEETRPEYTDFEVPDGVEMFGEDVMSEFTAVAGDLGLSQEQAQRLIDKLGPAQLSAQKAMVENTVKGWVDASRADEEVGGANYKASVSSAVRAVDKFATPEFRPLLTGDGTKLASHPEMLRFLARVGDAISPDRSLVNGSPRTADKVDMANPLSTPEATAELFYGGQ